MASRRMSQRIALGTCALMLWILCFACGVFIETTEYRVRLAPHAFPQHVEKDKQAGVVTVPFNGSPVFAFAVATVCFTPTNLAFLALLGGLLGGCSSNIYVEDRSVDSNPAHRSMERRFLDESPWSAMMRSFIVYLCVIAGLYFVVDDPFKDSTPSQYVRLAGTVSVLALLVGYDPSRIAPWLYLVDRQQIQGLSATKDAHGNMTIKADEVTSEFHTKSNGELPKLDKSVEPPKPAKKG